MAFRIDLLVMPRRCCGRRLCIGTPAARGRAAQSSSRAAVQAAGPTAATATARSTQCWSSKAPAVWQQIITVKKWLSWETAQWQICRARSAVICQPHHAATAAPGRVPAGTAAAAAAARREVLRRQRVCQVLWLELKKVSRVLE